jgi:hypothetical protein
MARVESQRHEGGGGGDRHHQTHNLTEVTDAHSYYEILIAVPWQQWLRERASVLHL